MDEIDKAIASSAAAAVAPSKERRLHIGKTIPSTGRRFEIDMPADLSVDEFRTIVGWMAADMPREAAEMVAREWVPSEPIVDIVAERRRQKAGDAPAVN